MCAADAQVLTGQGPFARAYVHAGMVGLDGEKMSKSKGNLVFVSRLRGDGVDPMAIRLALLAHHYRTDWEWTDDDLKTGEQRLARWRAARGRHGPAGTELLAGAAGRLADDLDTPRALAVVDSWAEGAPSPAGEDPAAPALVRDTVDALLGIAL